jgi:PAS domain S-box-containing protein
LVHAGLEAVAPGTVPFASYFPAVLAATLMCGWPAGLVTLVAGTLLSWYVFVPPRYSFAIETLGQGVSLALFVVTAGTVLVLAERLRLRSERLRTEARNREAAEARLALSAAELETVLATVPAAVWFTYGERVEMVRRNRRAAELMRVPDDSTVSLGSGNRIVGLEIRRDGVRLRPEEMPLQRALRGEASTDEELQLAFADGSVRTLLSNAQALRRPDGGIVGAVSVSLDITERKAVEVAHRVAEAALRESEARFRAITDSIDQMIWSTRPDGYHDFYNQRWYEYTGVPPGSTDGAGWNDMFHPDDQDRAWGVWRQSLATGEPYKIEYRLKHASGQYRWVLGRAQPVRDETGRITRWFGTCTDIQDIVEAREVLARSREELERLVDERTAALAEANRRLLAEIEERERAEDRLRQAQKMEAVGQLTGGIAHDFNNLLAVITGSLQLLRRRLDKGETGAVDRYVDAAMDGAERAATLTHRLLAFSRQQPLAPESLDANRLVTGMSELLRRTLGEDIRLETVLAGGLWTTHADTNQLENAVLNLAVNARDAMREAEGMDRRLTIETANVHLDEAYAAQNPGAHPGQYVMIAVSDTGAGMPPDVIAKAFDPFFTTKPTGQGTGLGLSQVYGFVRQSGGHIKIYSEPGQGTSVKVYLPRFHGPAEAADPAPERLPLPTSRDGETILIVEDEASVRRMSAESLRELGYRTLEADGAMAALRLLDADSSIRVLFTDIVMPEVNGRRLADEALRRRPDLKVLFTTGYTRNAIVHNGVLDPGVDLLPKPFTLEQLAAKMRGILDRG